MATLLKKNELFENFFTTAQRVLYSFELVFEVPGVCESFFGTEVLQHDEKAQKTKVRKSLAWRHLDDLFEYAINGIVSKTAEGPVDTVIDGGEVISFLQTENYSLSSDWDKILWQADGRFALDDGQSMDQKKLAFLAGVDIRTVKNAVSSGELIAIKDSDESAKFIENSSARNWLAGRKGYVATKLNRDEAPALDQIDSPVEFGEFFRQRLEALELETNRANVIPISPGFTIGSISDLKMGVFRLPISAVLPLADFLEVDRSQFLRCVMKVFFREELELLQESNSSN